MFNNRDFTKPAIMLAETWKKQDTKKFGFMFAHMMDAYLQPPKSDKLYLY